MNSMSGYRSVVWAWIAGAAVAVLLAAGARPAAAQGQAVTALSGDRALLGGSASVLGTNGALMRFSLDGALVTGHFDDEVGRSAVHDGPRALLFNWDTAFSLSDAVEVGARIQLSYRDNALESWLGPEMWAAAVRGLAYHGEAGDSLTLGGGVGQRLAQPGGTLLEVDTAYGIPLGTQWRFDLGALLSGDLVTKHDDRLSASAALGPVWQPLARLKLGLDVAARVGTIDASDQLYWDMRAALRVGVLLGTSHELALSARRTLAGQRVDEETALLLTWQFQWKTEDGFLALDDDGGPSPEPEE